MDQGDWRDTGIGFLIIIAVIVVMITVEWWVYNG